MPRGNKSGGAMLAPPETPEQAIAMVMDHILTTASGGPGGHWKQVPVENSTSTAKIILPEKMTSRQAIHWLEEDDRQQNTIVEIKIPFDAYPADAAVALATVLERHYGGIQLKPEIIKSMFGTEIIHPKLLKIKTGPKPEDTKVAHWGHLQVADISGFLATDATWNGRRLLFQLSGQVLRKDEHKINELADLVKEELRTNSIFRGRAIKVSFRDDEREDDPTHGKYKFDPLRMPEFISTNKEAIDNLVFADKTQELIDNVLYGPIINTASFRANGIPLKRGILCEGPYGTGKTLLAHAAAWLCEQYGWTMIYVKDVRDLDCALELAAQYQPAMIFGEDLDRAVAGENRTSDIDRILNTIDGIDSKSVEIMVVLTTNHVDDITQAMIRPGRVDVVIPIRQPDAKSAYQLIKGYSLNTLIEGEDEAFEKALKILVDQDSNAAVYREAVERAKAANIVRQAKELREKGEPETVVLVSEISPSDIGQSAQSMERQLELLKPKAKKEKNPMKEFGLAVGTAVAKAHVESDVDYREPELATAK